MQVICDHALSALFGPVLLMGSQCYYDHMSVVSLFVFESCMPDNAINVDLMNPAISGVSSLYQNDGACAAEIWYS